MGSYYEGLPIYKAAADLVVRLDKIVRCFSRYHKYNLGTRLREKAITVVLLVARCNRKQERKTAIYQLCNEIEEFKILVNLGTLPGFEKWLLTSKGRNQ